ncbi:ATPase, T2SS/T4P/T4SS family [Mitsuaria sp. CC2]|uniref:GspE/PulE family protein n=1 Tax=Mitsuaria sp. CC2 TaxID=3029186 RepID=UPI003B8EA623
MNRHIDVPEGLPPFERVLTVSADASLAAPAADLLPVASRKQDRLAALALGGGRFLVVSAPDEVHRPDWYRLVQAGKSRGLTYAGHLTAAPEVFAALLDRVAALGTSLDEPPGTSEAFETTADERQAAETARDIDAMVAASSPLEWFRALVQRCRLAGASDLHVELRGAIALARVRLDGRMRELGRHSARTAVDGLSAAYTMLAEERSRSEVAFNGAVPQAAMIPLDLPGARLTLRYQSHPAVGGMDVVIRLLRASGGAGAGAGDGHRPRPAALEPLGFTPWQADRLREALASAWGGVFVAGVTGSGKTTTLNAMMTMLARDGSRKLFTIEDPVEYETPGVSHLSIQRGAAGGADPFHGAMLAFLRMDPDVGLFGEIRDGLSASMAQAAIQTGHKILSTVHATSALGIVGRLSSRLLGLAREDLCDPEFLSAMVYQVLMPVNCDHCKRPAAAVMGADAMQVFRAGFGLDPDRIYCASANGCTHCRRPGIDYGTSMPTDTLTTPRDGADARIAPDAGTARPADDTHEGTAGVKVGAEVIVPDLRLLDLLRQGRDAEARRHWRRRRKAPFTDPDMDGKDAWGHVLYDVAQGRVDPYHFERTFGSAALLAQTLADDDMSPLR